MILVAYSAQTYAQHLVSPIFQASDPQFGVPPSTITNNTILTSVSIYYLTRTFETAESIYYQNAGDFQAGMRRAINQVPMGFASYQYELQYVVNSPSLISQGIQFLQPTSGTIPSFTLLRSATLSFILVSNLLLSVIISAHILPEHSRGGHFSALDNPPAYVQDIRDMMGKWYKP